MPRVRPRLSLAATTLALTACLVTGLVGLAAPLPDTSRAATATIASVDPAIALDERELIPVIVQKQTNDDRRPEAAVARLGGTYTQTLSIVDGFAATMPSTKISDLASTPGVRVISLDRAVGLQENQLYGTVKSPFTKVVGSHSLHGNGITGQGITVALIDTGVTEVPDLAGRIVPVTNDNGESQACANFSGSPTCNDEYGHGTFIAGLIAGNGAASGGKWVGTAPGARILSVKIAGRDGSADVSNLLAAIQWTVGYKDRYGVRVLNLSLGTNSSQSYTVDPLNFAVEKAWDAGIVVVVSAANLGPDPQTVSKPGDDPLVITVGATDDQGTVNPNDDAVPNFSSRGPTKADGLAKPDITAPGAHVISLRAPGSAVDELFPWYVDGAYRRGSGTSFSAAVVSGSVAQVLQARPGWTPDRVKHSLMATANNTGASSDPMAVGAGLLDVPDALSAPAGLANQGVVRSNGMGSLDLSRGTVFVTVTSEDPEGSLMTTLVSGMLTAQLVLFDPVAYTTGSNWNGSNWNGSNWNGSNWNGSNWNGSNWNGSNWNGSNWNGSNWNASSMYGSNWNGSNWNGVWS